MLPVLVFVALLAPLTGGMVDVSSGEAIHPAERPLLPDASANLSAGELHDTSANLSAGEPARLVDVYPNPPIYNNRGEFVTVAFPPNASFEEYTLADNYTAISLAELNATAANTTPHRVPDSPAVTPDGVVTFSSDVGLLDSLTDRTLAPLSGLRPAADGDTIRLLHRGEVIDALQYGRAPEGEVYDASTETWQPLEATDRPIVTAEGGAVEVFVLPDDPDRATEFLRSADRRILLGGYTLSSPRVVETLIDRLDAGVDIEILVDGSPVGGMTGDEAAALDTLDRAGVTVTVIGGQHARYRHHHAKYAVVDEEVLVTTENWKPAGLGGASSRGWAAITDRQPVVEAIVDTFRADTSWVDGIAWADHDPTLVDDNLATGRYPAEFEATQLPVDRTHLLLAPDNAKGAILDRIDRAEQSVLIKQVQISDREFPLLQALLDAAERGVTVRVLLSSAWYAEEPNRELQRWLDEQAEAGNLSLSVRLVDGGQTFDKLHAKGIIIDEEQVLVGSMNWNSNSMGNNREVALLLEGKAVGEYFIEVFDADWERSETGNDDEWELPVGVALAVLAGVIAVILGATRIEFGTETDRAHADRRRKPPETAQGYSFLSSARITTRCNGLQKSHAHRVEHRVVRRCR